MRRFACSTASVDAAWMPRWLSAPRDEVLEALSVRLSGGSATSNFAYPGFSFTGSSPREARENRTDSPKCGGVRATWGLRGWLIGHPPMVAAGRFGGGGGDRGPRGPHPGRRE